MLLGYEKNGPLAAAKGKSFHRISRIVLLQLSMALMAVPCLALGASSAGTETGGNSSTVNGTVADPTGAVVPGATVVIHNPVSQYSRTATTDGDGKFSFTSVPVAPYHLSVSVTGFAPYAQDVDVRSAVALNLKITLQISASAESVTVQGEAG